MSEVSLFLSGLSRFGEGLPALEALLSRARYQARSLQGREQTLLQLFDLDADPSHALSIAALTALIDLPKQAKATTEATPAIWMRVDPVHLRADLKRVFLFDSGSFSLDQEQADELRASLAEVFSARGLTLTGSKSCDHWYLQLTSLPDITTHTLSEVRGCDVLGFLPSGPESRWWRTLHNEVQMTLHESELNLRRARLGEMPVNAVWFWGQGCLPAAARQRWGTVCARDTLSEGLATHSGTRYVSAGDGVGRLDELIRELPRDLQRLLIINPIAPDLQGLEQDWLAPLVTQLRRGRIKRLTILSEEAEFSLSRASLACVWRRRKPLSKLFPDSQSDAS